MRILPVVLSLVALVGLSGCASRSASVRTAADADAGVTHVVAPGQTLWRIARAYGVTVDELARANGIDDPTRVAAGKSLTIPGATAVVEVPAAIERPHAVADFSWPIDGGQILSYFGAPRRTHRHQGIDIAGHPGQPVVAAFSGRVVYAAATMRGYGKTIIVDHGNGLRSLYAHNAKLLVEEGERVKRGQSIAKVGRTGNASTDHCHFEIRRHDVPIDPLSYVDAPR